MSVLLRQTGLDVLLADRLAEFVAANSGDTNFLHHVAVVRMGHVDCILCSLPISFLALVQIVKQALVNSVI